MANDRLYLICRVCGDSCMLFKYYPGGGFIPPESIAGPDGGRIGNWIDEHIHTFDTPIPLENVPELVNEDQAMAQGDVIQERKKWWDDLAYLPTGMADRSALNPYRHEAQGEHG
jgi:hypothetical protein